jgi:hypothetical protein
LDPVDPQGGVEAGSAPAITSAPPPAEPAATVAAVEPTLPVPPVAPTDFLPPIEPPKRSRGRFLVIGAGIVVVAGIVIGAVVASSGGTKPSVALSPAVSASSSPSVAPTVAPPVGFTAEGQTSPFGVSLSWSAPAGQSVQGYRIYRGTVQIAAVPSGTTTYLDANVSPGKSYTYAILTRGEGLEQSDKVSANVEVPVPSLASARLQGTFSIKFKTTSQTGYVGSLGTFTLGWKFTPKCGTGSCTVALKDVSIKDLRATLKRQGASYSGADSAKFIGSCGGVTDSSDLTIDFKVAKARVIDGEWRATKVTGTVVESHPALHGCTSGGAHFSITGTFSG